MVQTVERPPVATVPANTRRRVAYFAWHFAEMCAAMCVAQVLISLPFIGIAKAAGTANPLRDLPELATIIAATAMSVGMALQMRWRRHGWRCIAEMTAAMAIEAVLLIVLAEAGTTPRADLFVWYHALMPVAMIVAMVYRLDLYTSPPTRHATGAHP